MKLKRMWVTRSLFKRMIHQGRTQMTLLKNQRKPNQKTRLVSSDFSKLPLNVGPTISLVFDILLAEKATCNFACMSS